MNRAQENPSAADSKKCKS